MSPDTHKKKYFIVFFNHKDSEELFQNRSFFWFFLLSLLLNNFKYLIKFLKILNKSFAFSENFPLQFRFLSLYPDVIHSLSGELSGHSQPSSNRFIKVLHQNRISCRISIYILLYQKLSRILAIFKYPKSLLLNKLN